MSMKPILFSTPMVQAILDGRKTMTRRVVKPQPTHGIRVCGYSQHGWSETKEDGDCHCHNPGWHPYQVDDVLWVRETWAKHTDHADSTVMIVPDGYLYKASGEYHMGLKWRPSIFMPREAARIFLRVTDVRAERLQMITCEDVYAEGVPTEKYGYDFEKLWDSINAKRGYSWESNPWVWVYTFERVEP